MLLESRDPTVTEITLADRRRFDAGCANDTAADFNVICELALAAALRCLFEHTVGRISLYPGTDTRTQ